MSHSSIHRTTGMSVLGMLLAIPALLVILLIFFIGFYEVRKAYWDYQVREMCAKDGGVKISEIIEVDQVAYESLKSKFGQISIPKEGSPDSVGSPVVHSYSDSFIRRNDPEVRRSVFSLIKASSGRVVASSITYSRVGGDLFALHPSVFSCPSTPVNFYTSVIRLKEGRK